MLSIDTGCSRGSFEELTLSPFDDCALPFARDLKLTLCQARKYPGNQILRYSEPGEPAQGGATFYGTLLGEIELELLWCGDPGSFAFAQRSVVGDLVFLGLPRPAPHR